MVNGVSLLEFNKLKASLKVFKIVTKARFAAIEKDQQDYGEEDTDSANKEDRSENEPDEDNDDDEVQVVDDDSSSEDELTTIGLKAFKELTREVKLVRKMTERLRSKLVDAGLGPADPSRDLLGEVAAGGNENSVLMNAKAR